MTGFFNAKQRRKLAFVSWGALKKPRSTDELPLHQYSLKGFGKRARLGDADEQSESAIIQSLGCRNKVTAILMSLKGFGKRELIGMPEQSDGNPQYLLLKAS